MTKTKPVFGYTLKGAESAMACVQRCHNEWFDHPNELNLQILERALVNLKDWATLLQGDFKRTIGKGLRKSSGE